MSDSWKRIVLFSRRKDLMEFALYISSMKYFEKITKNYIINFKNTVISNKYLQRLAQIGNLSFTRIYFGSEFCERLIPTIKELKKVIDFCDKNVLNFTLLTPFVTDITMKKLKELFEFLKRFDTENLEIVFNDWGVFHLLKNEYEFNLAVGRLLTKQKKDPSFIEDLIDEKFLNLDSDTKSIIKGCSMDASPLIKDFLLKNVLRIELDNVYQGIDVNVDIKKSLYYPFVPVTTTRFCMTHSYALKKPYIRGKNPCNKECLKTFYKYTINNVHLFLKGNTQFYCNNQLPQNVEIFDRIVFEPLESFISSL